MNEITLAHGQTVGFSTYGAQWLYLLGPIALLIGAVVFLIAKGSSTRRGIPALFERADDSLERVTGMPGWASGGIALAAWSLLVAVVGFLWDVAWHIDFGRDEFLFTPSHMMILVGLMGITGAGLVSTIMATLKRADTGFHWGRVIVPFGALPLLALGMGAVMGFPLDELWHKNYGIDVTMWGPTHLLMIAGASFAPLAMWLLLSETRNEVETTFVKIRKLTLAAAVLIGFSTFQGEFDFGVPQFQHLYHPVLIAVAAGFSLTLARTALGKWGAIKAALGFIVLRGLLALLIGPVLDHTIPHFPLYVGAAIAVEIAFVLAKNWSATRIALTSGALVGTVGLGTEWAWTQVWGRDPWGSSLFPGVGIAVAIAIAAAILGMASGRILSRENAGIPRGALVVAGLAIIIGLALPLPRNDAPYEATLITAPAGEGTVDLTVELDGSVPANDADWFQVLSWQGGTMENVSFEEIEPGTYHAIDPVHVGGEWKTMVRLARKDELVAVPVYLPADDLIGASEVPVEPRKQVAFQRDTQLLLRESTSGPTWPSLVAYSAILAVTLVWIGAFILSMSRLNRPPTGQAGTRVSSLPSKTRPARTAPVG